MFRTTEAKVATFCTHVGYIKSQRTYDKLPFKRRGQSQVIHFQFRRPQSYHWNGGG